VFKTRKNLGLGHVESPHLKFQIYLILHQQPHCSINSRIHSAFQHLLIQGTVSLMYYPSMHFLYISLLFLSIFFLFSFSVLVVHILKTSAARELNVIGVQSKHIPTLSTPTIAGIGYRSWISDGLEPLKDP